jgi:hypothetical protein
MVTHTTLLSCGCTTPDDGSNLKCAAGWPPLSLRLNASSPFQSYACLRPSIDNGCCPYVIQFGSSNLPLLLPLFLTMIFQVAIYQVTIFPKLMNLVTSNTAHGQLAIKGTSSLNSSDVTIIRSTKSHQSESDMLRPHFTDKNSTSAVTYNPGPTYVEFS